MSGNGVRRGRGRTKTLRTEALYVARLLIMYAWRASDRWAWLASDFAIACISGWRPWVPMMSSAATRRLPEASAPARRSSKQGGALTRRQGG